ncbi:hypothetical protein [Alkalihalobacillus pseudalcaliphilus]|nr:hypothetical protein [Alkalihalobacillus pseudalcaliphilus]
MGNIVMEKYVYIICIRLKIIIVYDTVHRFKARDRGNTNDSALLRLHH